MSLPGLSDYQQAVQEPGLCFQDPELRACKVENTPLGLPRVRSGGFAITFHLFNHRDWAVRCFYKSVPDLEMRYRQITAYLRRCGSARFVHFEYQPEGILVAGQRYPIVKMEWVKGETLGTFLERHYQNRAAIRQLYQDFADLVLHLEELGVAHGDLQHGNIIVETRGQQPRLRLIDYDGMYVPGMEALFKTSNEVGHPHYQHPERTNAHFGPYLDRFSAAVIYLSLFLIEQDPALFKTYSTGENLLFTSADYADPAASQLIRELRQRYGGDRLWQNFEVLLGLPPDRLPSFRDFYSGWLRPQVLPVAPVPGPRVARTPYPVLAAWDALELLRREGQTVEVIGRVMGCYRGVDRFGRPYVFLNFADWKRGGFYVVLWHEELTEFERRGLRPEALKGQWVSVTGLITSYLHRGAAFRNPQIQLEGLQYLRQLSEEEARQRLATAGPGGPGRPNRDLVDRYLKGQSVPGWRPGSTQPGGVRPAGPAPGRPQQRRKPESPLRKVWAAIIDTVSAIVGKNARNNP